MRKTQSRLLFSTLLLLYCAGRVLQLFAGKVPNLIIVAFHVMPAALFALVHGARIYRLRGILVFLALCLGVATLSESVSLRTGFPFGHYRFTDLMGPKIYGLPILLALAYTGMGYLSWIVSLAILSQGKQPSLARQVFALPLMASFVMTAWDFSMEAVWADVDHVWVWRDGGPYYGVPISNFFGWLFTTYVFYQLFAFYLRSRDTTRSNPNQWLSAIAFYALSSLGNLLVVAPSSVGRIFVDATGRHWMISSVLGTSRVVSIFLMMPISLIALLAPLGRFCIDAKRSTHPSASNFETDP